MRVDMNQWCNITPPKLFVDMHRTLEIFMKFSGWAGCEKANVRGSCLGRFTGTAPAVPPVKGLGNENDYITLTKLEKISCYSIYVTQKNLLGVRWCLRSHIYSACLKYTSVKHSQRLGWNSRSFHVHVRLFSNQIQFCMFCKSCRAVVWKTVLQTDASSLTLKPKICLCTDGCTRWRSVQVTCPPPPTHPPPHRHSWLARSSEQDVSRGMVQTPPITWPVE